MDCGAYFVWICFLFSFSPSGFLNPILTYFEYRKYGGDSEKIHLLGHESGAHLITLSILTSAANDSKFNHESQAGRFTRDHAVLPPIKSVMLIDPIVNLNSYYHYETKNHLESLSKVPSLLAGASYASVDPGKLAARILDRPSRRVPSHWCVILSKRERVVPDTQGLEWVRILENLKVWHVRFRGLERLVHGELIYCVIRLSVVW